MATLYEAARTAGVPFSREVAPMQRKFQTSEVALSHLEWGQADRPLVLLLHGFAQNAHSWDFVSLALADRYRVISLDARGHGDSEWAPDGDYSTSAHQRDLDQFIEHLADGPVTLIGLSMGGRNSYVFAARHPERVRAIAIVDTGPVGKRRGGQRIRDFVGLPDRLESPEEFVERIHRYTPRRSIEDIRNTLFYKIKKDSDGKWTWKYDPVLRDPNRPRPSMDPTEAWRHLEQITCPTLLVRGKQSDVLSRTGADEMVSRMKDCTLVEIDGAGHLVAGDNPRDFIGCVRPWLDRVHGVANG